MAHNAALAAVAAFHSNRNKPSTDSNHHHSRHSSTMSQYFDAPESGNQEEEEEDSPPLSALDSSAALVLVHDESEDEYSPIPLSDDEDGARNDNDDELVSPLFEVRRSAVFPPLSPALVFLYLLAPYLRLGALNIPYTRLPLKYGLPALLLSSLASAFARQIWYMLARYLRKASMTDVLLDTFARARRKERQRLVIRSVVKIAMTATSVFLAVTYLRYSMYALYPIIAKEAHPVLSYVLSTSFISVIVAYLSYARSLDYRRITYSTWLSLASYMAWLGCIMYAHSKGLLRPSGNWLGPGSIWPGLATTVFAFCSSSTLPLYASLKSASHPIPTAKVPLSHSFRFLSSCSLVIAVLLLLPSTIFAAFPNHPAPSSHPIQDPANVTAFQDGIRTIIDLNTTTVPILDTHHSIPPEISIPSIQMIRILSATTLILGIPSVLVTTPPIAFPPFHSVKLNLSRVLIIAFVIICSLIPPSHFPEFEDPKTPKYSKDFFLNSSGIFCVLTLITLFMAYMGTYFVPTFLHVSQHFFKRPLAIVVPRTHTSLASTDANESGNASQSLSPSGPSHSANPRLINDELLLRKERALQKKQFKKRIVSDIGVWTLFLVSIAGVVGYCGYLAGAW